MCLPKSIVLLAAFSLLGLGGLKVAAPADVSPPQQQVVKAELQLVQAFKNGGKAKSIFPEPPIPPSPPAPPPAPGDVTKVAPDLIYVIKSDEKLIVISSPEGPVSISEESGPLRIRGKFVDHPTRVETRSLTEKYLYFVDASSNGRCELIVWPVGAADAKAVQRRLVESNVAPLPPPPPPIPPVPPVPPPPPTPTAIRVLVVYEKDMGAPAIGPMFKSYLNETCKMEAGLPAWRMCDKDWKFVGTGVEVWQKALAKVNVSQLPRLAIFDYDTGNLVADEPLPATDAARIEKVKSIIKR